MADTAAPDIIWKLDRRVFWRRYLYKPMTDAGRARFGPEYIPEPDGWYGFGNWSPNHPTMARVNEGLVVAPAPEDTL